MRLSWPSKVCVDSERDDEEHRFARGDAWPDFLCVGAQKAGTSWLYHQLASHADFWMPPFKELHYFDQLSRIERRNPPRCKDERDRWFVEKLNQLSSQSHVDLESYAELFEAKSTLLSGDITPSYSTLNDELIERIVGRFPDTKIIFLARDPVERAWSQLSMEVRQGTIPPFDATNIGEVVQRLLHPCVLVRSHLSKIVARWKRYVRPDLFRVYFFDELENEPAGFRRSILRFLGADPDKPSGRLRADHNSHAGLAKLQLTDRVRSSIAQFFSMELKACAEELGGPAKQWPARYGFSLLWFVVDLLDDLDLFAWCDWIG